MLQAARDWVARARCAREKRNLDVDCKTSRAAIQAILARTFSEEKDPIPVFIVCYNNGVYVDNMVRQLVSYNVKPIIIDNASSDPNTLRIVETIEKNSLASVVRCKKNFGHMVGFLRPHYEVMPEFFAYSDPDLQFSPNMPGDFLKKLADISCRYRVYKAGLALSINAPQLSRLRKKRYLVKPFPYYEDLTIEEWESQFWRLPVVDHSYEIYAANIDTTFAVYCKSNYKGVFFDAVRVAGAFEAIHLPWYPEIDIMNEDAKSAYLAGNRSSSWIGR